MDNKIEDGARTAEAVKEQDSSKRDVAEKFLGVTLKGWAISAISSVAVLSAFGTASLTLYGKYQSTKTAAQEQNQTNGQLVNQNEDLHRQLNPIIATTKAKLSEAEKHRQNKDHYETFPIVDDPEVVKAEYYPIDGCIHIIRLNPHAPTTVGKGKAKAEVKYGQAMQDEWIPDLTRNTVQTSTDALVAEPKINLSGGYLQAVTWDSSSGSRNGEVNASRASESPHLKKVGMFQANCLNPHPGAFQVNNVQVNACIVQVWRRFADGCTHFQLYNACNGVWDPNVEWQFCANVHRW